MTTYLSILQYCPDLVRQETANIGLVLLYKNEQGCGTVQTYIKVSTTNRWALTRFPERVVDKARLKSNVRAFVNRLQDHMKSAVDVVDFDRFRGKEAGSLQLTDPYPVRNEEYSKAEDLLDFWFPRLVE